ncbi:MAG: ATP-binding protein [Desulfobacteraceae bacterium]|jgi:two-component system sensor histidine kinase ChiS
MKKNRFSISIALALVLSITLTVITSGLGFLNYRNTRNTLADELDESLQRIATRLQINLASPFYDMDIPQIRAIIKSEMENRNLYAVVLTEFGEEIFFSAVRDKQWRFSEQQVDSGLDPKHHLTASRELILKDDSVNGVRVVMTDRFLLEELGSLMRKTVIGVIFINMMAIVILFICLRFIIITPISELRRYATDVSAGNMTPDLPNAVFFGELSDLSGSIQAMVGSLREFIEKLERLDKLKDEFLANTSHELRTPLHGIIGIAESLHDGAAGSPTDDMRANLAMIIMSGKRLSGLVDDILDFSKLKTSTLDLQIKPVNIRVIADIVLTLSRPLSRGKTLALTNAIDGDFPFVDADENRLQQILHNLVGNSIKFTHTGTVTIFAESSDDMAQISVSDTGIGIASDKLDRIFEPFEQADGSISRKYGGTGIGLSISKQLVELQGGTLQIETKEGEGTTITFSLPLSRQTADIIDTTTPAVPTILGAESGALDTQEPAQAAAIQLDEQGRPGRHVLVVDDEIVNQQVLKNVLTLDDYTVFQAFSGNEALEAVDSGQHFDLVLLDVMMPMMSGYELCEKIRETLPFHELPIIMLSAKNQIEDLVTGLNAGANDYLTKPISREELLARLKTHLNLKTLIAENARMSAELDVARRLQQMVLPKPFELDGIKQLDIACHMQPAEEVGGDYYDILPHDGGIKIGIGDVTGHGLESGVLMLMAQTAIRTLITHNETEPIRFLSVVNRTIYDNIQRMQVDRMMSLSLIDYCDGRMRISGQHEEILLVRRNGQVERLDTIDLGAFVGITEDISDYISEVEAVLEPGDGAVLYTDGIIESHPEGTDPTAENLYGLDRLCDVVSRHWHLSVEEIRWSVIEDVTRHMGRKNKIDDDLTLIILKQK